MNTKAFDFRCFDLSSDAQKTAKVLFDSFLANQVPLRDLIFWLEAQSTRLYYEIDLKDVDCETVEAL